MDVYDAHIYNVVPHSVYQIWLLARTVILFCKYKMTISRYNELMKLNVKGRLYLWDV